MKVQLSADELYPVYGIDSTIMEGLGSTCPIVEVSDSLYARYEAAQEEFDTVQEELKEIWESTKGDTE